jgi:hypothetical protein
MDQIPKRFKEAMLAIVGRKQPLSKMNVAVEESLTLPIHDFLQEKQPRPSIASNF